MIDAGMSPAEVEAYNKDVKSEHAITLEGAVLLSSTDPCLSSLANVQISVRDQFVPISQGFEDKERTLQYVTIAAFIIMIPSLIGTLSLTVYRSFRQKQTRLEFFKFSETGQKLEAERVRLNSDRQVLLALAHMNDVEEQMAQNRAQEVITEVSGEPERFKMASGPLREQFRANREADNRTRSPEIELGTSSHQQSAAKDSHRQLNTDGSPAKPQKEHVVNQAEYYDEEGDDSGDQGDPDKQE